MEPKPRPPAPACYSCTRGGTSSLCGGELDALRLVPVTLEEARRFVGLNHRHNRPPVSWKFGVGVELDGKLVGVAMAGRPVARGLDARGVIEITRVCTEGERNACTRLYGAILRAAKSLGYHTAYTYTLASESGASLKAAGWEIDETLPARPTWDTPSRRRVQLDMFGEETRPAGEKIRWVRRLAPLYETSTL
jgi:hypothetical protein